MLTTDIINKDRGNQLWWPTDLYSETNTTGFVPNPRDLIVNELTSSLDRVVSVNYAALTWEVEPFGKTTILNSEAILGGHYPLMSDKYVAYVDTTKLPATLVFHENVTFKGADVHAIRIFRGNNISDSAEILSGYYVNGALRYNYLPVSTISSEGAETVLKQPLPGSLLADVKHGEAFSFAVYNDVSDVLAIGRGYFVKTNLVMALETPSRQVLNVKLVSPFILDANSKQLLLPISIPIDSIPMHVEVQYSDGTKILPIDGSRVKLVGLRNAGAHSTHYIASNAGHELPLKLSYKLSKGESYAGSDLYEGAIVKDYTAVTEAVKGAYALKLFVVPKWLDANRGYRLYFYLYNLTRGTVYDATPYVEFTGGTAFDPVLYGYKQHLNVQVDISQMVPGVVSYTHPQSFNLTLVNPGNAHDTNFLLEYVHEQPALGQDVYAKFVYSNIDYTEVDVSCDCTSKQEWMDKLYKPCYPLYDRRVESGAPEPTHFEIHVGGYVYTFTVDEWMNKAVVNYKVIDHEPLIIRWVCRTPNDDLQVGLSSMLAHNNT